MFESFNMQAKDWITLIAVIAGPILAVQAQKYLESLRERKQRRATIFNALMSTRAERLQREHVRALNMIDIEFYGRQLFRTRYQTGKEKSVTNAWKNYNDHLNNRKAYETLELWLKEGETLFTNLLYKMSIALGYDFDEVQLKRDCYRPQAHANLEETQLNVLTGLADVLNEKHPLSVAISSLPSEQRTIES